MFKVSVEKLWLIRQDSQWCISTHSPYRVLTILSHRRNHADHILLGIAKGLLLLKDIIHLRKLIRCYWCHLGQVDDVILIPVAIRMFCSHFLLDFFIGDNPLLVQVDKEHLAWFQTTLVANIFRCFVHYAHFRSHDNAVIVGYIVTSRTEAIAVQDTADDLTIGKADSCRTIPRFHEEGIEFIEVVFFLGHELVLFPRFWNHHHHCMRQGPTSEVQEFQGVVEHSRVRPRGIHNWEYLFNIREETRLSLALAGVDPVYITPNGVDFTIVDDVAVRMSPFPRWEGISGEAGVNHGQSRGEIKVIEIQIEVPQLFRCEHPLVDDGPR